MGAAAAGVGLPELREPCSERPVVATWRDWREGRREGGMPAASSVEGTGVGTSQLLEWPPLGPRCWLLGRVGEGRGGWAPGPPVQQPPVSCGCSAGDS